jgi:DNA polymerase I
VPVVAFDTETYRVQPGLLAPPLVCGSFASKEEGVYLYERSRTLATLENCLERGYTIVGHRVAYDFAVACAEDPSLIPLVFDAYAAGRVRDTAIRQELIDIARGRRQDSGATFVFDGEDWVKADYSLAGLAHRYLGKDRRLEKEAADRWQLRFDELDGVPVDQWPAEARDYALADAQDTLAVYYAQAAAAGLDDALPSEVLQTKAAWALHLMSCWGVRTDGDAVAALEVRLKEEKARAFDRLRRLGFYKPRRATPAEVAAGEVAYYEPVPPTKAGKERPPRPIVYARDQKRIESVVEHVYRKRGVTPERTESGRIATDRDTLKESGSRALTLFAELGGVEKILGTYVPALKAGAEHPTNARFNVLVNSGRTSCSNPNLQNLPSGRRVGGTRECFVPRPGYYYASVDYDTLELRALAQVCLELFGTSRMAEAIRAGRDLHLDMAANMLGISYDDALARHKKKDPAVKRARDAAKVANFGLPGGLSPRTLVDYARSGYGLRVTFEEAQTIKNQWIATWPEMAQFFSYVSSKVGEDVTTLVDPLTGYVRGGVGYCDGCNHHFQHRAASGAKAALFEVAREAYAVPESPLYGSRPVVFVHDEIIAEVPADRAHEASARLAEVMCREMAKYLPDLPVTAAPALMTRWTKSADAVYDANGWLVPWEPAPAKEAA